MLSHPPPYPPIKHRYVRIKTLTLNQKEDVERQKEIDKAAVVASKLTREKRDKELSRIDEEYERRKKEARSERNWKRNSNER